MSSSGTNNKRNARVVQALAGSIKSQASLTKEPVKVLVLGLPRCATSSLQAALNTEWLDCNPTFHMTEVLPNGKNRKLAMAASIEQDKEKRQKILAQLVTGYAAITDLPMCAFALDLMDMYPDAKIILNQRRDGKTWAKSVYDSIYFFQTRTSLAITGLFPLGRDAYFLMHRLWKFSAAQLGKPSPYTGGDPSFGPEEYYDAWMNLIRTEAKKRGRPILEWQPQDGWKPICEFLERPVPPADVPFPKTNETAEILKVKKILYTIGAVSWTALGTSVYLAVRYGPQLARDLHLLS